MWFDRKAALHSEINFQVFYTLIISLLLSSSLNAHTYDDCQTYISQTIFDLNENTRLERLNDISLKTIYWTGSDIRSDLGEQQEINAFIQSEVSHHFELRQKSKNVLAIAFVDVSDFFESSDLGGSRRFISIVMCVNWKETSEECRNANIIFYGEARSYECDFLDALELFLEAEPEGDEQ